MSHLILTTNDLAGFRLRKAELASIVIGLRPRFVGGQLPSEPALATLLEPRSAKHDVYGSHWLDDVHRAWLEDCGTRNDGFLDFCKRFDSIELWVDPQPNDQLVLVWLLDLLRPYKEITTKLSLVHADDAIVGYQPESLAKWKLPTFKIADSHLALASRVWQAWRAPTPEPCFDLLMKDLMILPHLRMSLIALLKELPDQLTGLGATEMDMLEYIDDGCDEPNFVVRAARHREIFNEREAAELLDELAQCSTPAFVGMGDAPFDKREEARANRYRKSRVSLTKLGRAIMAGEEDFSRHNAIHRWWGGTLLTNERLWRWDPQTRSVVAPA